MSINDPKIKLVVTDDPESLKNYECADCDFVSDDFDEAAKHTDETRNEKGVCHEIYIKRGQKINEDGEAISPY